MGRHNHFGARRPCVLPAARACAAGPAARIRARQRDAASTGGFGQPGHARSRCPSSRTRRGYPAELGSCWYRRFPWSPLSWRHDGPHS
jgi:hypothetical protein